MRRALIIDYGSGNIHSALRALQKAAQMAEITYKIDVSCDAEAVKKADYILLPGVGHFADCASGLKARDGLSEALEEAVLKRGVPFLGICVGMQLMADFGMEDGGMCLHVENLYGENSHHIIESCFKATARAMRQAISIDPRLGGKPASTKGKL